jgi:hypothetical protein
VQGGVQLKRYFSENGTNCQIFRPVYRNRLNFIRTFLHQYADSRRTP